MGIQQISNSFAIKVGGRDLPESIAVDGVEVDQDLHAPDAFRIVLRDPARDALSRAQLRIGTLVDISVVSDADDGPVELISGEVTALEATFSGGSSSTVVRGFDESHRLFRGRSTASYQNMTYADIAGKVARRAGLSVGEIADTSPVQEHVTQANESDWSFLSRLAAEVGFEVRVRRGQLHFEPPVDTGAAPQRGDLQVSDPLQLTLGSTLLSFQATVSAAEQVGDVEVRGWDWTNKEPIVVSRPAATTTIDNGSSPSRVAGTFPSTPMVSVGTPFKEHDEVDYSARALSELVAASHTEVEGVARGSARLRAGTAVRLELTGEPFDGTYVLTSTTHCFDPLHGYTTAFVVSGRERRSLLQLTSASNGAADRVHGVVTALVEDVNDPDELCRVRLRFPWMDDDYVSDWSRVVMAGAGPERGCLVMPEPRDEVMVSFDQGDLRRPYVLGGLYNRLDRPAPGFSPLVDANAGEVNGRSVRSRTGHRVVMVDAIDGAGIEVVTADGRFSLELDQDGERVAIASAGNLEIDVEGDVRITAGGAVEIEAGRSMALDASGSVKVTGRTIELN
jgi:uncharacterized protein involved in type VI secretion and phage assembly